MPLEITRLSSYLIVSIGALLGGITSNALAVPSITVASITGGYVSVSGLSFGTKSPAEPILFETFDSGTNGQSIGGWNGWVSYNDTNGGYLSNISPYSGTLSAYNRITGPNAASPVYFEDSEFNTSNYFFSATDEIYYSYVAKYVVTGDDSGVDKWGRVNCAPNTYNGPGDMTIQLGYVSFNTGSASNEANDDDGKSVWLDGGTRFTNWTRQEMYRKLSTPGVANGMVQFRVGPEMRTWTNIVTRGSGYSFQQTNIMLGLMLANAENDGDHRMYVDDVYVDKTRARVEVCTGSTWSNRGSCNPQPPTDWSATSISATANTIGLADEESAYVYVVDSDGAANSAGYLVTIGAGAPAQAAGGRLSGSLSGGGVMR